MKYIEEMIKDIRVSVLENRSDKYIARLIRAHLMWASVDGEKEIDDIIKDLGQTNQIEVTIEHKYNAVRAVIEEMCPEGSVSFGKIDEAIREIDDITAIEAKDGSDAATILTNLIYERLL